MVDPKIEESWKRILWDEFQKPYFETLKNFLVEEKKSHTVYPSGANIFAAFDHTPFDKVEVVILGQDPYHGAGQAHGLSFSVQDGVPHPPSLQNIFKELKDDLGCVIPKNGNLTVWANQGVFLLNTVLTVRASEANSHRGQGWETFTDTVIKTLSEKKTSIWFLYFGAVLLGQKLALLMVKNI